MHLNGITKNEEVNNDARFLDSIRKVFDSYETSLHFTAARNQIEIDYRNAKRSVKKRIKNNV